MKATLSVVCVFLCLLTAQIAVGAEADTKDPVLDAADRLERFATYATMKEESPHAGLKWNDPRTYPDHENNGVWKSTDGW